ncbi:MAG: hypothetical protein FH753_14710 [Firmicutes bacterium]|nr:hypothetical protein [Bacillota bacterium]
MKNLSKKVSLVLIISLIMLLPLTGFAVTGGNNTEKPTELGKIGRDKLIKMTLKEHETLSFEELSKQEGSITYNEYYLLKKLKKKTNKELKEKGYTDKKIKEIKEFDFAKKVKKLSKKSVKELSKIGYNHERIEAIKSVENIETNEISDVTLATVGSNVTINLTGNNYEKTGTYGDGETSIYLKAVWAWDWFPSCQGTDIVAAIWGKDFNCDVSESFTIVTEKDYLGNIGPTDTVYIEDKKPNTAAYYHIDIPDGNAWCFGTSWFRLYNNDSGISSFEAKAAYGHSIITGTPSVSFPSALSISFNKDTIEMDSDPEEFVY